MSDIAYFFAWCVCLFGMLALAAFVSDKMEKRYRKEERKRWSTGKGGWR